MCWAQEVEQSSPEGADEVGTWHQALIFHLPFDEAFDAASSGGNPTARMRGDGQFIQGRKGRAGVEAKPQSSSAKDKWDAAHINRVEMGPQTPHLTFNRPSAQGAVRVLFFVPYVVGGRDVAELAQRCDVDFKVVTAQDRDRLGWDGDFFKRWEGLSTGEKISEALARLDEAPQVIVLGNINFPRLPPKVLERIMEMVNQGTGLIPSTGS